MNRKLIAAATLLTLIPSLLLAAAASADEIAARGASRDPQTAPRPEARSLARPAVFLAQAAPAPAAEKAKQKTDDLAGRPAGATDPNDPRLAWYREAKFGLFIHWGLYAVPAGTWKGKQIEGIGEWIMNRAKIPVKEYEQLAKQFNPVKFNADEWCRWRRMRE